MIEGIKLHIEAAELATHFKNRRAFHMSKAQSYEKQIAGLAESASDFTYQSNNPIQGLKTSMDSHKQRSAFFGFLADHLIQGETYEITESDLSRLELVDRYLWQ